MQRASRSETLQNVPRPESVCFRTKLLVQQHMEDSVDAVCSLLERIIEAGGTYSDDVQRLKVGRLAFKCN